MRRDLITDANGQRAMIRRPPQGVLLPKAPEMVERWNTLGFTEMPAKTPEQFATQVERDLRDYGAIIKAGNIKSDWLIASLPGEPGRAFFQ